ncbi:unnamed protein product [Camellia sinensis]
MALNFTIDGSSTRTSELYLWRDCGQENTLKPGDVIQCRECGYRILYKKRTRRSSFSTKHAEDDLSKASPYNMHMRRVNKKQGMPKTR